MTETATKPTKKARRKGTLIVVLVATVVVCVALLGWWYLTSAYFAALVRAKVVEQLESATGGRVEIGRLDWTLSKLDFELRDVTIHGLENQNEVPYLHVDRIHARGKVGSLFHRALGLRLLELERPIVHLIVYPDGSTNQPRPKERKHEAGESPVETLFEFSINKADLRDGQLLINDRKVPIDFSASEFDGTLVWMKREDRYDVRIHAGKMDAKIEDMRPFAAALDADVSFWRNAAELRGFTFSSGKTRVEGSARLDDFRDPAITVKYRGTINLTDLGSITRLRELRAGTLKLDGTASYKGPVFQVSGKASVRQLDWFESWAQVRDAAADFGYSVDRSHFVVSKIVAKALGGDVVGDVSVDNWCATCVRSGQQARGSVRLLVSGVSVRQITVAVSTRALPLSEMNLEGTAGGTVNVSWQGTASDAVTRIDAFAENPAQTTGNPVAASMRGAFYSKTQILAMDTFSVTTAATHGSGSGTIGKSSSGLRLSAATSNLNEFTPLVAAHGLKKWPLELHGRAVFDGTVRGALTAPSISGRMELSDFESSVGVGEIASGGGAPMHWDEFSANIDYGQKSLGVRNGVLRRGPSRVNLEGSAQLVKGEITPTSPFVGRIAISDADIGDLQAIAGSSYPIGGKANLDFQLSGTPSEPRGNGRILVTHAVAYGEAAEQVRSDVVFSKKNFQFENLSITDRHGRITGRLAYDFGNGAYALDLRGAGIAIDAIHALQKSGMKAAGTAGFHVAGTGTLQAPSFNGDVEISKLSFGGEQLGRLALETRTRGEMMAVDIRSDFLNGSMTVHGAIHMRDSFDATATARFDHVDLRPLWVSYAKGNLTGRSYASGEMSMRGPLKNWRQIGITTNVADLYLPVENLQVRNVGPLKFAVENQVVTLDQFHVAAEDTDLSASGNVQLAGERRVEMRADGRVNLKLLQTMAPDFTSYGAATVNVRMTGDLSNPRTFGRIQITNAGISYIDVPIGLSEINGTLAFNRDRLQVETLTARTGGGYFNLNGYVTYGRNVSFNLQGAGSDIRLRYPQGISSIADANLRLTGTPANALLAGDVIITKFGVTPQFDLANYIAKSKQPPQVPKPDSLAYNVKLDVHVTSSTELQVQTALAKVSGNVDLRLRGSAARPVVLGRVNIVEGDVSFQGTKYHVERGDVTFANPMGITPIFDIAASTRVRDYDITLGFHGSTERLTTTYRSDPPLATADIIALLAFGRTREESARQLSSSQAMSEQASNAILGQALNATVSSRMQKLFGVSRIKIDPEVGGAENNPSSARVTIEQQVAKNLTITYITDLARSNQQIISAEYNVTRAVSIVALRDQYGIVSFDVRIRQRKK